MASVACFGWGRAICDECMELIRWTGKWSRISKRRVFRGRRWQPTGPSASPSANIRSFVPNTGFSKTERIACPEFTGSYLSYDGERLYLSQWYKHRILKLDAKGNILRAINVGAEISGHTFVDGMIYVLRGTEQNGESWTIARLDLRQETPEVKELATVPFACRSLTFDGEHFWSNHRAANEIISFVLPNSVSGR